MIRIFLGFTFLIAAFFPIGGQIAQMALGGMYSPAFKSYPPIIFHVLILVLTYAPAAIVTWIFIKFSKLNERISSDSPGQNLLVIGVVISILYLAIRLLASTVQGGGASFVVMQFAPLVLWPARIILTIGAVKILLAASPLTRRSSGTPNGAP